MPHVSALFIYPLKSARGVPLESMDLDERGAANDRRWMIADHAGVFVSQREEPRMALVSATLTSCGLSISAPGMPAIDVERPPSGAPSISGSVWDGACEVRLADDAAHEWFSAFLGRPVRLVFQPDDSVLPMLAKYAGDLQQERRIALTDGSPLLLIGQESLDDLNRRLATPLPMNRFRPNVVVADAEPYAEDSWRRIGAGSVLFEIARPCPRCVTTTVDQATGIAGDEPLRTLATYRKLGSKVLFGQNVTHHAPGRIRVGDEVLVEATKSGA